MQVLKGLVGLMMNEWMDGWMDGWMKHVERHKG